MLRFADAAVAVVSTLADQQERERQAASANATPRSEMQDAAWVTSVTDWMDLSHFNAEQQTTIRNFLQYVGMASLADEHDSQTGSRDGVDIIPQVGLHRSGSGQKDRASLSRNRRAVASSRGHRCRRGLRTHQAQAQRMLARLYDATRMGM